MTYELRVACYTLREAEMSIARLKKDDTVVAITGAYAGQTGKILQVYPSKGKALVEGLNMRKKTVRRSQEFPEGGIVDREAPMALSNLMLFDAKAKKGVRISRVREAGKAVRKAKVTGHVFES